MFTSPRYPTTVANVTVDRGATVLDHDAAKLVVGG
jgi:hypothetical protein